MGGGVKIEKAMKQEILDGQRKVGKLPSVQAGGYTRPSAIRVGMLAVTAAVYLKGWPRDAEP